MDCISALMALSIVVPGPSCAYSGSFVVGSLAEGATRVQGHSEGTVPVLLLAGRKRATEPRPTTDSRIQGKARKIAAGTAASTGPQGMVWIRAGEFTMGSPAKEFPRSSDESQWKVVISRGFWICDHEVTWSEYNTLMEASVWQPDDDSLPVTMVSWLDATSYCEKLTQAELASGRLVAGQVYRLPTEAEWEFAARAGSVGPSYGVLDTIAWWIGNAGGELKHPKLKKMNGNRLFDMIGNVSEWCGDIYDIYPSQPGTDPTGGSSGNTRVVRGGSYLDGAEFNRSAARNQGIPEVGLPTVGFRIVRGADLSR